MNKETILVNPLRRRTNSHAGILQQYDSSKSSALKQVRRLRRPSFTLSGDRPDSVDDLINAASTAAHNHEAVVQGKATIEVHRSHRCSISLEGQLCTSPVSPVPVTGTANCQQEELPKTSSEALLNQNSASEPQSSVTSAVGQGQTWYNSAAFSSNPLKSNIIIEYLARIAVNNVFHPTLDVCQQQWDTFVTPPTLPSVVISTLPHALPAAPLSLLKRDRTSELQYSANFVEGSMLGDVPQEAGSNSKSQSQLEFYSETGLQLPSSHRRHFPSVARKNPQTLLTTDNLLDSGRCPSPGIRFDVSRLYDGFPAHNRFDAVDSTDPASLRRVRSALQMTDSPAISDEEDAGCQTPSRGRLRALFNQLRPAASSVVEAAAAVLDVGGELRHGDNDYIYPNQEAQERRAKAQVANLIAPVSF